MGYVPLFDSLVKGTLHGRWPDIGLWPIVLSLADRHGNVDVTPEFIAGVTGLSVSDVIACMARFCDPDPRSRSAAEGGRRLELIDSARTWGWHIVNHSAYREKARLMARDSERTASGLDAERKRLARAKKAAEHPPASPDVTPSDGDGDVDVDSGVPVDISSQQNRRRSALESAPDSQKAPVESDAAKQQESPEVAPIAPQQKRGSRLPEVFPLSAEMLKFSDTFPRVNAQLEYDKFCDYWRSTAGKAGVKLDWFATWRNWIRNAYDRLPRSTSDGRRDDEPAPTRFDKTFAALERSIAADEAVVASHAAGVRPAVVGQLRLDADPAVGPGDGVVDGPRAAAGDRAGAQVGVRASAVDAEVPGAGEGNLAVAGGAG